MTRVLFVSTSTTLGGAEKTLYCLATGLDPRQFQVAGVVSLKPLGHYGERLAGRGLKTQSLGMRRWPSLGNAAALAGIVARERPDLVHAVMYQAIQLCRFVKGRAGAPFRLISSPRVNYRTRPLWTLLVDRWFKAADDLLICESEASREFLLRRQGYAPDRVRTIYNGVDAPRPEEGLGARLGLRRELGLSEDAVLAACVGRLDVQKGHEVLIEAWSRLPRAPELHCVIIGDGPLRGKLEAEVRRRHLEDRVHILGERADARSWLRACDIFVLPSLWEGLPNALLEAMSLGLPVVASAVDGICEVVRQGQDGLLVPPRDPAALSRAIASLRADPQLRRNLGESARLRVTERFSFPAMMAGYAAAYRDVLSRPAA